MRRLVIILAALATVVSLVAGNSRRQRNLRADRVKAEYALGRAGAMEGLDNVSLALLTARHALVHNPGDIETAAFYASIHGYIPTLDSAAVRADGMTILRAFDLHPTVERGKLLLQYAEAFNDLESMRHVLASMLTLTPSDISMRLNYADLLLGLSHLHSDSSLRDSAMNIFADLDSRLGFNPAIIIRRAMRPDGQPDTAFIQQRITEGLADPSAGTEEYVGAVALYRGIGMPDSAISVCNRLLLTDPSATGVHALRVQLLAESGDSAAYMTAVTDLLQSPSVDFSDKTHLLRNYILGSGNSPEARTRIAEMFDALAQIHSDDGSFYNMWGAYLAFRQDFARAAEQLEYAVALDPSDTESRRLMAHSLAQIGDTVGAVNQVRESVSRGDNALVVYGAYLLSQAGRGADAIALLDLVEPESFGDAVAVSNYIQTRGDIYWRMDSADMAYQAYREALQHNPDNYMAMNNLAYYLSVNSRDLDEADRLINRALLYDPENPTLLDTQAWVRFKRRDYPGAKTSVDHMLTLYGIESVDDLQHFDPERGAIYEVYTDTAAIDTVKVDADSDDHISFEVLDHAGDIYYMNGYPDEAVQFWKAALLVDPDNKKTKRKVRSRAYFFDDEN